MMKKKNVILVLSVLLIALASFHYETNSPTGSSLTYDGPTVGIGVLVIIGIVLLFKLTSLWADILVGDGRIARKPNFPFDWLILAAILINFIGYRDSGEWFTDISGQHVPSWLFEWGQGEWKDAFIFSVIAMALLLRVYAITKSIACSNKDSQTSA